MSTAASFIKFQRNKIGLTQKELATKAGVGIRFIRELEQGKETLQMDKVNQVLAMFGFGLIPGKQLLNAYDIYLDFLNKEVKITLTNKIIKYGVLLKEITDPKENQIASWCFLPNKNVMKYNKKSDIKLTETISHSAIKFIEEQQ